MSSPATKEFLTQSQCNLRESPQYSPCRILSQRGETYRDSIQFSGYYVKGMKMKLTNRDSWHTFAGGIFAASNRNSFQAFSTLGDYQVNPISSRHNSEKHLGYIVYFVNCKGTLPGRLYHSLGNGKVFNLRESRKLCQKHLEENGGKLIPEQIPGYHSPHVV